MSDVASINNLITQWGTHFNDGQNIFSIETKIFEILLIYEGKGPKVDPCGTPELVSGKQSKLASDSKVGLKVY